MGHRGVDQSSGGAPPLELPSPEDAALEPVEEPPPDEAEPVVVVVTAPVLVAEALHWPAGHCSVSVENVPEDDEDAGAKLPPVVVVGTATEVAGPGR